MTYFPTNFWIYCILQKAECGSILLGHLLRPILPTVAENTYHRGKYHCMADLMLTGFDSTKQEKLLPIQHKQSSWK